jgi:hypothetical protein
MKYQEFLDSLAHETCPERIEPCLQALWYDATGDWNSAHEIVQKMDTAVAARIHAYLHRKEGDDWNSRYWHRRAGSTFPQNLSLEQEWASLLDMLIE